jgi:cytosine permease
MSNGQPQTVSQLPSYIASAANNPWEKRAPWFKTTAPTYAGIFLWFVFWQEAANKGGLGGTLAAGLPAALLGLVLGALICHFLFYLVPGLLGMKTGLPLYIVGTSTFGAQGGFLMPGFLMGVLQFGWLGVNAYFSGQGLSQVIPVPPEVLMVIFVLLAAFIGMKGIQYVARVSTYLPLIPVVILLVLLVNTLGSLGNFSPAAFGVTHQAVLGAMGEKAGPALGFGGVLAAMMAYTVGFFATAGAAGVDFGMNSRDKNDVHWGGLIGVALATIVTAGAAVLIVAGASGASTFQEAAVQSATDAVADKKSFSVLRATDLIPIILSKGAFKWIMFLLVISALPGACFSSFIAANSFKTTLPKVNPFISVGIGALVSIILAVTALANKAQDVFAIVGASFGPICGAMMVDYLLSGGKWTGPRAGFNPAGWIAWALGFIVGILPNLHAWKACIPSVPAAPVAAFIVGAVIYFICAKAGILSAVIPWSGTNGPAPAQPAEAK